MRNLIITATVASLAACGGPSGKDVAMAKQARYSGDKLQMFAIVKETVEKKYKLDVSDETKLALKTTGRWYTPEGLVSNWTPEDGNKLPDKSLNISLVAQLLPESSNYVVHVEPVVLRFTLGLGKLEPVRPDDPSLPGFVNGKSDELSFDVHKKLQQFEVKSPGGNIAPAPAAPATEAAPPADTGSGAAPAPAPTPTPAPGT